MTRRLCRRSWRPDKGPPQRHGLRNSANALSRRISWNWFAWPSTLRLSGRIVGVEWRVRERRPARGPAAFLCHDVLLAVIPVPTQLEAHVGVRIGADIAAARIVHVVTGLEARSEEHTSELQ